MNYKQSSPEVLRQLIRDGELVGHTSGMAEGYIQANVVILPSKYAYDFLKFCFRNPKTSTTLRCIRSWRTFFSILWAICGYTH